MGTAYDEFVAESQALAALQHSLFPERRSPERRFAAPVLHAGGRKRLTLGGFTDTGAGIREGAFFVTRGA